MSTYFGDAVAIVTGGASGMGRAVCEALARAGAAMVIVADVNGAGAEHVAGGITASGGRARAVQLDVTQPEAIERLIRDTASEHGRLDFMFNNAGIAVGGDARDTGPEHWRRIMDINLWAVIRGTNAAYAVMVQQGHGHIVNTASVAGLIAIPGELAYTTTKFGVVGLSTTLRLEGEALGVRVSVVCPGFIRTGIFDASEVPNMDKAGAMATLPKRMPSAEQAARWILDGVARNRAIIVFPFLYRFLWWLTRLHPALLLPLQRRVIRDARGFRFQQ